MNQTTWQDLPKEIQEEMLNEQERQGNKRDEGVFEKKIHTGKVGGGFSWSLHMDLDFNDWEAILDKGNFAPFYEKFPKKDLDTIAWDEPVEMLVWDDDESRAAKKVICGKFLGQFAEKTTMGHFISWKKAKPILPTINWDEFKEGDVVEVEDDKTFRFLGYLDIQNTKSIYISPSNLSKIYLEFQKSNIKSIRKLK